MTANGLIAYLQVFEHDQRLKVWHITLLVAVFTTAVKQGRYQQIKVSRSMLMSLSHISTLPTYHKYFKELQELGYIRYRPSYHPGKRSEVDIKKQPL